MFHIFIFLFIAILSDLKITRLQCWLTWWISNTNKSVSLPITMTSDDKAQSKAVSAIRRSASSTAFLYLIWHKLFTKHIHKRLLVMIVWPERFLFGFARHSRGAIYVRRNNSFCSTQMCYIFDWRKLWVTVKYNYRVFVFLANMINVHLCSWSKRIAMCPRNSLK